ncbi:hypothetical protein M8494_03120 [Serratia ureilytica]
MRDDSRKRAEVLDYLKAENRYTEQMMAPYRSCAPRCIRRCWAA